MRTPALLRNLHVRLPSAAAAFARAAKSSQAIHRLVPALLLGGLALGSMGAADTAVRYAELGHQMVCTCSCGQILIECNHVGCPDSPGMLQMLRVSIAGGGSDESILRSFQAKYGPTVLAAPMFTSFNKAAWVVPPAVLAFGLVGAIALIRRWRLAHVDAPLAALSPQQAAARDRIRRETEL